MPSSKKPCPFCAKFMATHNLKPHVKRHLAAMEAQMPENWVKHPSRDMYLHVQHTTAEGLPAFAAVKHMMAVCGSCCKLIRKKGDAYKDSSLTPFDLHVCRPANFTGVRKVKSAEGAEASAEDGAAAPAPKAPAINYETFYADIRRTILSVKPPKVNMEKLGIYKDKMIRMMAEACDENTDGDDVDYKEALLDIIGDLSVRLCVAETKLADAAAPAPDPAQAPRRMGTVGYDPAATV